MLSQMFRRRGAGPMLHTSSMSIGERSTIGTSIIHALQGSAMALALPTFLCKTKEKQAHGQVLQTPRYLI